MIHYITGLIGAILLVTTAQAQPALPDSSAVADTVQYATKPLYPYNTSRVKLVAAGNIIGYGGAMAALYSAWYANYPQTGFHTFNDNHEWLQVDKVGHAFSAYVESYGSMEMWRWAGLNRKQRIWVGGLSGAAYQTVIEVLDGFSAEWGWSWGDIAANFAGSGLLIAQELIYNEQRIKLKFSFHQKKYGEPALQQRADELYGRSPAEQLLKDYNGQTYWLSAHLRSYLPHSNLPNWLNVAIGYGADGMFGAGSNVARDQTGHITFDGRHIRRHRQWYLAPDIDLTKIRTRSKVLRTAFGVLNVLKFPAPALEFSNNRFTVHWLYF